MLAHLKRQRLAILQTWTSESGNSHLWQVVDIEIYGHVGLDLIIGVDCSVFLILSLIIHHLVRHS